MIQMIARLMSDFFGLRRACGVWVATRWLWNVARYLGECIRSQSLQPADLALGNGPFRARLGRAEARVAGPSIVTGIREIWVRDCYLAGDFLSIGGEDVVVDLGANIGTFTMLALGSSPGVRVVAVEPNAVAGASLLATAKLNGWQDRLELCRSFLGGKTATQDELLREPHFQSPFLSEQEFISRYKLKRIDFLKCDIEGSEFELLKPASALLTITRQLAIELHTAYGDVGAVIDLLREMGFEVIKHHVTATDCVLNARRKL